MSRRNKDSRTKRGRVRALQIRRAKAKAETEKRNAVEAKHKAWLKELEDWETGLTLKKKLVEDETGEWWAYHIAEDGTLLSKR